MQRGARSDDTYHDTGVLRATDNAWEHGAGGVIAGKAGFAHTRTIVNYQGLNFTLGLHNIIIKVGGARDKLMRHVYFGTSAQRTRLTTLEHTW
jgi:hypothetical protein